MPLFKIETKTKDSAAPEPPPRPTRPTRPTRKAPAESPSALPALIGGAVFALVLVGGVTAFLVYRGMPLPSFGPGQAGPAAAGGQSAGGTPAGAGSQAAGDPAGSTGANALAPAVAPAGPLNKDYPPEHVVAYVNSEQYTMADLEVAVRISHALASLSHEQLPDYNDPKGMKELQVKMLRRQIDTILLRQAFISEKVKDPGNSLEDLINGYAQRVGATRAQLDAAMTANGVTQTQMRQWFEDSRKANVYIQLKIVDSPEQTSRDPQVQAWLKKAWEANAVVVDFYDPSEFLPTATPPPNPAVPATP